MQMTLTTRGTAVWFFSSMTGLVLQKLSVCVEGFSTLVTGERLVCDVSPLMFPQIAQVVKS